VVKGAESYFEALIPKGVPLDYGFEDQLSEMIGPKSDPLGIAEESGASSGTQRFSRRAMANPYNVNIDETICSDLPGHRERTKPQARLR
jgi:hypothetical protein